MKNNLYSLEEAQAMGTKIIEQRSNELKKDLLHSAKSNLEKKDKNYV